MDIKSWLDKNKGNATLLGICPISRQIIHAALREAAKNSFIPMFIATPRQVDDKRGYTEWSQEELVQLVQSVARRYSCKEYLIARDHGGPYQSIRDRGKADVSPKEAMSYAKETFSKDLESNFNIIHVDATQDDSIQGKLELNVIADRTTKLIDYCESIAGNVYYEVGSEEVAGELTEPDRFEKFIRLLKSKLIKSGNKQTLKKLLFIVGQVGTDMKINMSNQFNPSRAKKLVQIATQNYLFLKVHYTDWLDTSSLKKFPELGIGAANVGPEFSSYEIKALAELEKKETDSIPLKVKLSSITEIIEREAVDKAPWQRYVPPNVENYKKFAKVNRRQIALCVGRYVMKEPAVVQARQRLHENLHKYTSINPEQFIIKRIEKSIRRYVEAFNLAGTTPTALKEARERF